MVTHYVSSFNHSEAVLWHRREGDSLEFMFPAWRQHKHNAMKTSLHRGNGMFCMRESHWNGHFCLSPESDDGVRLKVLREHVYQFKLRRMIITPWRAQCRVPECVKAVIISKKRTMWESVSLPLCFRTESSQCARVKVCASFFEPSQKKKQVKWCSHVWLLCPLVAHLSWFYIYFNVHFC